LSDGRVDMGRIGAIARDITALAGRSPACCCAEAIGRRPGPVVAQRRLLD
jgi:hypothetical protein